MSAILFGSISTIADTSEMQREAFNKAFELHGLAWRWGREEYVTMLQGSGGQSRIEEFAAARGETVDAAAIHRTKSELFQNLLTKSEIAPRPGVVETIKAAKGSGYKVALVTTTSHENITALTQALGAKLPFADFDLVVDSSNEQAPKPDKASFVYALEQLGETAIGSVAVEDNVGGVHAAVSAGLSCVAFPNVNTAEHAFDEAGNVVQLLDFQQLRRVATAGTAGTAA